MTPRRQVLRAISEIEKTPPEEQVWILIYLKTGQKPPADETIFERDTRIRRYRLRWHADLSERAAAAAIASEGARYRAGSWRHHQHLASMPAEIRGARVGDLFDILKWGDIPAAGMIRRILQAG